MSAMDLQHHAGNGNRYGAKPFYVLRGIDLPAKVKSLY